jgi:hypothetical protein
MTELKGRATKVDRKYEISNIATQATFLRTTSRSRIEKLYHNTETQSIQIQLPGTTRLPVQIAHGPDR